MSELEDVAGRAVRVVVGGSVHEMAVATVRNGTLYLEFAAADLEDLSVDVRWLAFAKSRDKTGTDE